MSLGNSKMLFYGAIFFLIMQAIQRYHYNRLQQFLYQLQQESEAYELPTHHRNSIVEQEEKLKQLYVNYQQSLQQVAILIKQYEIEHQSVRRLVNSHKQLAKVRLKTRITKEFLLPAKVNLESN